MDWCCLHSEWVFSPQLTRKQCFRKRLRGWHSDNLLGVSRGLLLGGSRSCHTETKSIPVFGSELFLLRVLLLLSVLFAGSVSPCCPTSQSWETEDQVSDYEAKSCLHFQFFIVFHIFLRLWTCFHLLWMRLYALLLTSVTTYSSDSLFTRWTRFTVLRIMSGGVCFWYFSLSNKQLEHPF